MNAFSRAPWTSTAPPEAAPPLLELRDVTRVFGGPPRGRVGRALERVGALRPQPSVLAVDSVSLAVRAGEVLGLVGESGCGKSTLGRITAGLLPPTRGEVRVDGRDMAPLSERERTAARLAVQMVFQDPFASLNPRLRVTRIVGEGALRLGLVDRDGFDAYVGEQMRNAGLDPALRFRYPHQFSGGQRQRIGIARALAVRPRMLVCDEAVASLVVTIQAQIINLFMDLRDRFGLAYLFISHDLGVVRHISDRVAVMYLGRVVESGAAAEVFARPAHPYTRALLAEVPSIAARRARFNPLKGEIPSPLDPPSGCHFHPRCPIATARCRAEPPRLRDVAPGHDAACHLADAA